MSLSELPPLSLYLHYPWCIAKCPYCDFNSHQVKQGDDREAYIARLTKDTRKAASVASGRPLTSVYLGGGTPSLMQASEVETLLGEIDGCFGLPNEVTLETNPGTFELEKFKDFRAAGVTRLSIGVQSFQDDKLTALGRVHNSREATNAVSGALELFERVNLDLMYGLPGQSLEDVRFDLKHAIGEGVGHISWYQLTIEPRTVFHRRPPLLPVEDESIAMEDAGLDLLEQAGFQRYEISAFAREGEACVHNLNYWEFGDYIGIGAGAHGKLTMREGPIRTQQVRQPRLYMNPGPDLVSEEPIAEESLAVEFMMNALRLIQGVEEDLFEQRTGLPLSRIGSQLERVRSLRLMRQDRLGLTEPGLKLLDSVVAEFLP